MGSEYSGPSLLRPLIGLGGPIWEYSSCAWRGISQNMSH